MVIITVLCCKEYHINFVFDWTEFLHARAQQMP